MEVFRYDKNLYSILDRKKIKAKPGTLSTVRLTTIPLNKDLTPSKKRKKAFFDEWESVANKKYISRL